jgi:hypothetical protein
MPLASRGRSIENPRAMGEQETSSVSTDVMGPNNAAAYTYHRLKQAVSGDRLTINFGNSPPATKSFQFGKLIDLVRADAWMKHCIQEIDEAGMLTFSNSIVVVFK